MKADLQRAQTEMRQRIQRRETGPWPMLTAGGNLALEKHYDCAEVAKLWACSEFQVRKLFECEPDVLRIGVGGKRVHVRIPESVVQRVWRRLASKAASDAMSAEPA